MSKRAFGHIYRKRRRAKDGAVVESRKYYIRYTDPETGRRYDVPGGETKREAEKRLGELRADLDKHGHRGRLVPKSLEEYLPHALATKRASLQPSSYMTYHRIATDLAAFFGRTPMHKITRAEVRDWVTAMSQPGRGRGGGRLRRDTIARFMSVASATWRLAIEDRHATENPWLKSKKLLSRKEEKVIPYLSADTVVAIYKAIEQDYPDVWPFVVLIGETGMRRGEVWRLRWEDVNQEVIIVHKSKSGARRDIPISSLCMKALERLAEDGRTGPVVKRGHFHVATYEALWRVGAALGIPHRVGLHTLRHAYASGLADAGVPITYAAKLLGHRSVTTTERYFKHLPEYASKVATEKLFAAREEAAARHES